MTDFGPPFIPSLGADGFSDYTRKGLELLAEAIERDFHIINPVWVLTFRRGSPWLEVHIEGFDSQRYAIWKATGAVHRIYTMDDPSQEHWAGAVEDDAFLAPETG